MSIVINHSARQTTPEAPPTIADPELVRELAKRDNRELADLLREATAKRPTRTQSIPSEYVAVPENRPSFVSDHGPVIWSDHWEAYLSESGWRLIPSRPRGNPHEGRGIFPQFVKDLEAIQKEWHQGRIEEAQAAIDAFKQKTVATLNAGAQLDQSDIDEAARLKADLAARKKAFSKFQQPEREAAKAAREAQSQEIARQERQGQRHQKNADKVERLFAALKPGTDEAETATAE